MLKFKIRHVGTGEILEVDDAQFERLRRRSRKWNIHREEAPAAKAASLPKAVAENAAKAGKE
jgi:hypothetical protein